MPLSARLKQWLIANWSMKANQSDDDFRKAAGDAIVSGDLTLQKLTELTTTKADEEANEFTTLMKGFGEALTELKTVLLEEKEVDDEDEDEEEGEAPAKKKGAKKFPKKKPAEGSAEEEAGETDEDENEEDGTVKPKKKSVKGTKGVEEHRPSALERMITKMGGTPDDDDDDGEERPFHVRVKSVVESYSSTKSAMIYPSHNSKGKAHPFAGRPVVDFAEPGMGRQIDNASDLDKAVAGSFAKFLVASATKRSKNLAFNSLPDHDKGLMMHALEKMNWGGASDGKDLADIKNEKLTPRQQKAIIDDASSGGIEAAPIVFDDMVIQTPLLYGELFPLVNTIPLDRGRRIEGVATGTVTGGWGGVDDTAIDLFDTTSYITAFDTTIFRWQGAIRIGLDFLSDTPIDFGAHVTTQYGERLLEDLDDAIATGNGTNQPEGITVKSGTTSVAWGGTTTLGNYESLRFGVAKPEHRANVVASAVLCGTETSYQRARAIPVGASDARRLGGPVGTIGGVTDYSSYGFMGLPYKINESLINSQIFYAILQRYRMYRRRGLTMRSSTEGDTLIRRNEMILTATARYGGQLERGAVAAITTTAPV